MVDRVQQLEERIQRAVDRLRALTLEREELQRENAALRERIETLGQASAADGIEQRWLEQRADVVTALQETLHELRSE